MKTCINIIANCLIAFGKIVIVEAEKNFYSIEIVFCISSMEIT